MPFEKTQASENVERFMAAGQPGDIMTVEKAAQLTQRDCSGPSSPGGIIVGYSVHKVERRYDRYWRWCRDRKVWHCLRDEEKPADMAQRTARVYAMSKRNTLIANSIDEAELDDGQRSALAVQRAIAGVLMIASSGRTRKRLEKRKAAEGTVNIDSALSLCMQRET